MQRRIVALRFNDGSELKVSNAYSLIAYLETSYIPSLGPRWVREQKDFLPPDAWEEIGRDHDRRQTRKLKNRASASKSRKTVTKTQLVAFLDEYERRRGTKRGGPTAACLEFDITSKTFTKRMTE